MTMSMKKIATLSLLVGNAAVLAGSAAADGWRSNRGHERNAPRHVEPFRGYPPVHHDRRDRTGDAVGTAVLGIGALIVGAAIADAAGRERRERAYERDED
jgi:hypothetical protein